MNCEQESKKLASKDLRLKVVKGTVQVQGPYGTEHTATHWWCVDDAGIIHDPTASQFIKIYSYNQLALGHEDCSRCRECGDYFAGSGSTCSSMCEESFMASFL